MRSDVRIVVVGMNEKRMVISAVKALNVDVYPKSPGNKTDHSDFR